jgi:hypothetical protein
MRRTFPREFRAYIDRLTNGKPSEQLKQAAMIIPDIVGRFAQAAIGYSNISSHGSSS